MIEKLDFTSYLQFLYICKKAKNMKLLLNRSIIVKSLIAALAVLSLKNFVFKNLSIYGQDFHDLIELSDITIIFTGAFFVFGLLLAATMSENSGRSRF